MAGILDWMGELLGEEQRVRVLPMLPFSMGEVGPIPIVDAPLRFYEREAKLHLTVITGSSPN